jgi:hypothetical protein
MERDYQIEYNTYKHFEGWTKKKEQEKNRVRSRNRRPAAKRTRSLK